MTVNFILIAGNIGSGKTSLTQQVGTTLSWQTSFESVADNPYLPNFYADMRQWSFHLQVFFLGHRAEQHLALANGATSAIADRSIYEDAYIFARALHHLDNLTDLDFQSYRRVYELVVSGLPTPDLLIYLKAPVPVLMERIQQRGRDMESSITADYLALLDSFYEEWVPSFDLCPVLEIPTATVDFVNNQAHLEAVISQIKQATVSTAT